MRERAELRRCPEISEAQRDAIAGLAYVRREQNQFHMQLATTIRKVQTTEASEVTILEKHCKLIQDILYGSTEVGQHQAETKEGLIASSLGIAFRVKEYAPSLAAFHFAKAAAVQQETGNSFRDTLSHAKKYSDLSKKERGTSYYAPADFLPEAYILRIAKKAAEGVELPSPRKVAEIIQEDDSLLEDYALVLPEEQRDEFMDAIPEQKCDEISIRMDKAISEVLGDREPQQGDAIKSRVCATVTHSLEVLKPKRGDVNKSFGGRLLASRWSGRQLMETIVNLADSESIQLLRDLSQQSIRELKAANKQKHLKQKSPDEKREALKPFFSFTGQVLNALIDVDAQRGGTLTMRYLETTALPDRMFTFFANKLIAKEYFSENLTPFLKDENIPVLKKLMAQYGPQFTTIIDTLHQSSGYKEDHDLTTRADEIFEALKDLGVLTPKIFESYRQKSAEDRKAFAAKIRDIKPRFFQNLPIKDTLDPSEQAVMTEMVYLSYKPNGMSFEQVEELISSIDDHTEDLADYVFPKEGYELDLRGAGKYVLKEGQKADVAFLKKHRDIFAFTPRKNTEAIPFADAIQSLLQSQHDLSGDQLRDSDEIFRNLFLPFSGHIKVQEFCERYRKIDDINAYNAATELREIMGVYFNDSYGASLTVYLRNYKNEFKKIVSLFSNPHIQQSINERFRQFNHPGVDWDGTNSDDHTMLQWSASTDHSGRDIQVGVAYSLKSEQLTAGILMDLITYEKLNEVRTKVEDEASKFTLVRSESSVVGKNVKAYISKNVGSFFAKAAADLCTSNDISLFQRQDHFHINVVENDEIIRGNNQAYIADVEGQPSLILRGFNPTAEWMCKMDSESYAEEIIRIGRQFQYDNGLAALYITENAEGLHLLSNRPQMLEYLHRKYVDGKEGIDFPMDVASKYKAKKIYKV